MTYRRFEYLIKDEKGRLIIGSFTLKEGANEEVIEELDAREVQRWQSID